MNIIQNNPFRILGVVANSRMKELQKNITTLNAYLSVGKKIELPFDDNCLGVINRNDDVLNKAKNFLQIDEKKIEFALFWFLANSEIDNVSIDHLKKGNIEKSIAFWEKQINKSAIDANNYSAFNNLGTLMFLKGQFQYAIKLKSELLNSELIHDFSMQICDENILIDKSSLIEKFIDNTISFLASLNLTDSDIVSTFIDSSKEIQELVEKSFIKDSITNLNSAIEEAKLVNKKGMEEGTFANVVAGDIGRELMENTKNDIGKIKNILGDNHFNFKLYADKLALQLEQCGIAYFNAMGDDSDYMPVYKYALEIAKGKEACGRLNQAIEHCKKMEQLNTCWFCGVNKVTDGCEMKFQMHKWEKPKLDPLYSLNVADILNQPRKYSYFKNGGLPIGRCKACYEIHNESSFTKLSRFFKGAPKPKIRTGDNASIRNHPLVIEKIHEGYEPGLPRS